MKTEKLWFGHAFKGVSNCAMRRGLARSLKRNGFVELERGGYLRVDPETGLVDQRARVAFCLWRGWGVITQHLDSI